MTETIGYLPKILLTLVVTNTVAIETEHDTALVTWQRDVYDGSNPVIMTLVDDNTIYIVISRCITICNSTSLTSCTVTCFCSM